MSENVGYATLTVIPSAKNFQKLLGGDVNPAMKSAGDSGGKSMSEGILGKTKALLGPAMAVLGTAAIGSFVKGTIAAASDLQQSIGGVDAIFGQSAAQIHKWASSAARDVGLSANQYNELANVMGAQLKNGGTALDQVAGKTNDLIGLGADMAATFGGSTSDAVEALSSALKGERDPIEKYGVSLTQAAVNAEAAKLGFQQVGGALSTQANQAATLSLIMKQTGAAQGQFAAQSNTLAEKQQILNALWTDGKAKLGAVFLPAVTAAAGVLISVLGPAIDGTVRGLTAVSGYVDRVKATFAGAATAGVGFSALFQSVSGSISEFISGGGLASALAGFSNLRSELLAGVASALPGILDAFVAFIPQLVDFITGDLLPGIVDAVAGLGGQLASTIAKILPELVSAFAAAVPSIQAGSLAAFQSILTALAQILPQLLTSLLGMLPQIITTLVSLIPGTLAGALVWLQSLITAVVQIVPVLLTTLVSMLPAIVSSIVSMLPTLVTAALGLFKGLVTGLVTAIPQLLDAIITALPSILSTLLGMLPALVGAAIDLFYGLALGLIGALPKLIASLIGALPKIVSALVSMIPTLISTAVELFSKLIVGVTRNAPKIIAAIIKLIPQIVGALIGAVPQLIDAGWRLIQGFIKGIVDNAPKILSAIGRSITNVLPKFVKDALGIHSPSRVFRELGQFTAEGFALGLEDMSGRIEEASGVLAPTVPGAISPSGSIDVGGGIAGSLASGQPAVYVQNPFTGEYLLAQTAEVAGAVTSRALADQARQTANGYRLP